MNRQIATRTLKTRRLTTAGLLAGISIVLSVTPLGYIPIGIASITTMHIPTILGAVLEGPYVGTLVGLIFGVTSFLRATSPLFADPRVAILPRLLIGIVSYLVYKITHKAGIAAAAGTLTNTAGVLSMAVYLKYLTAAVAWAVALKNGIFEIVAAFIITEILVRAVKKAQKGN